MQVIVIFREGNSAGLRRKYKDEPMIRLSFYPA